MLEIGIAFIVVGIILGVDFVLHAVSPSYARAIRGLGN